MGLDKHIWLGMIGSSQNKKQSVNEKDLLKVSDPKFTYIFFVQAVVIYSKYVIILLSFYNL